MLKDLIQKRWMQKEDLNILHYLTALNHSYVELTQDISKVIQYFQAKIQMQISPGHSYFGILQVNIQNIEKELYAEKDISKQHTEVMN